MAEKRKLLNEIDKCIKKIEEGVEVFEETMLKMQEANSENQREKFQDDLKKEIKKLQRLRDQIKGWQNSSDIKDKERLTHYRKIIEQRMEQFKDIERENKTKPHSKQGLSAEEKLDPREKEKADAVEWLQCQIRSLEDESDKTESRIEMLGNAEQTRKKGKKEDSKKGEKDKLKKLEDLRKHLDRIKFHISKLEVCMRLINNETIESSRVMEALREPFEMYIEALDHENGNDPEECDPENAGVYDELDLQSYTPQLGGAIFTGADAEEKLENSASEQKSNASGSPVSQIKDISEENNIRQNHVNSVPAPSQKSVPVTPLKLSNQITDSNMHSPPQSITPPPHPGVPYNVAAGLGTKNVKANFSPNPCVKQTVDTVKQPHGMISITTTTTTSSLSQPAIIPLVLPNTTNDENVAPILGLEESQSIAIPQTLSSSPVVANSSSPSESVLTKRCSLSSSSSSQQEVSTAKPVLAQATPGYELNTKHVPLVSTFAAQTSVVITTASANIAENSPANSLPALDQSTASNLSASNDIERHMARIDNQIQSYKTGLIPAWLGASPLGKVPVTPEMERQLMLLESALTRLPAPMDSEKPRSYLPKMVCTTPPHYPQFVPQNADTLEYYLRLSPETLFFVFYYMEGTRAQLLAAKALKKLSWRFHTKYLMWFQRHEEPKQITDDYEQGTYIYFDFEKWAQRKKEQFTFEYRYLEDRDFD